MDESGFAMILSLVVDRNSMTLTVLGVGIQPLIPKVILIKGICEVF